MKQPKAGDIYENDGATQVKIKMVANGNVYFSRTRDSAERENDAIGAMPLAQWQRAARGWRLVAELLACLMVMACGAGEPAGECKVEPSITEKRDTVMLSYEVDGELADLDPGDTDVVIFQDERNGDVEGLLIRFLDRDFGSRIVVSIDARVSAPAVVHARDIRSAMIVDGLYSCVVVRRVPDQPCQMTGRIEFLSIGERVGAELDLSFFDENSDRRLQGNFSIEGIGRSTLN